MTISRNSACPCGSGKKYKRCCALIANAPNLDVKSVRKNATRPLYSIAEMEAFSRFAALQLFAENSIHLGELQDKIFKLLKEPGTDGEQSYHGFLTALFWDRHIHGGKRNLPNTHSINITGMTGNVTVLPGVFTGGGLLLQAMINVLFLDQRNQFAKGFHSKAYAATFLMLKIAAHLAEDNDIVPFDQTFIELESVFVPEEEVLKVTIESCFLNRQAIETSLNSRGVPIEVTDEFILLRENVKDQDSLLYRPLLDLGGAILVHSPVNLVSALYYYLWKLAAEQGYAGQLNSLYQTECLLMVKRGVFHLGWEKVNLSFVDTELENVLLFSMDSDKLAVVMYFPDEVTTQNFSASDPMERLGDFAVGIKVKQQMQMVNGLLDSSALASHIRMFIAVIGNSGREGNAIIDVPEMPFLMFSLYDWMVLCHGGEDYHALTLWYFYQARKQFLLQYDMAGVSLVDLFALFLEHQESFYLSNEQVEHFRIDPALTDSFLKTAEKKMATMVLPYRDPSYSGTNFLPVLLLDKYDQVYAGDPATGVYHHLAITGFPQTIWFKPADEQQYYTYESGDKGFFQELMKMAAYWFNQVQSDLEHILDGLNTEVIDVQVGISDPERFFNPITEPFDFGVDHEPVVIRVTGTGLSMNFSSAFAELLDFPDNRGERYFLSQLLTTFNLIAGQRGLTVSLGVNEVIERVAPLGRKKKLTILNAVTDARLLGDYLGKAKYLNGYQTNCVLDGLIDGLEPDFLAALPQLTDKEEKLKFLSKLIFKTLIPKLRTGLSGVDSEALLSRLIGRYEAIVNRKKAQEMRVPTVRDCYPEHYAFYIEQVQERNMEIAEASVAYRCLIEFISAEQHSGQKVIAESLIDELLAIMSTIIGLGIVSDELYFDLSKDNLAILSSGRIGFQHVFRDTIVQPYRKNYLDLQVEQFHEDFDDFFVGGAVEQSTESKTRLTLVNQSYEQAFGFSFEQLIYFLVDLSKIGFEQKAPFARLSKTELIAIAMTNQEGLSQNQAVLILHLLGSVDRGNALKVPQGLDNYEASPWRYNRMLSYLSRPLVVIKPSRPGVDPVIYFGCGHLMDVAENMEKLMMEGRLRDPKLKTLNGTLLDQKGSRYNNFVAAWFRNNSAFEVFPEVGLPGTLGDVDVLAVDQQRKRVYLIEAKNTSASKSAKEMAEERDRFLVGDEKEKGWMEKHVLRYQALIEDPSILEIRIKMKLDRYEFVPFFITSQSLIIQYLLKSDQFDPKFNMPIIPFSTLDSHGVELIETFSYPMV